VTETFIGGFMSGFLSRGFLGLLAGYGLYFTTLRLFGVDPGSHGGSTLTGAMAGYIEGRLMPTLSTDENAKVIEELDRVKDFVLSKDQIQRIELKKPGPGGLWFGGITIRATSGTSTSLQVRHPIAYDRLVQLTQAFSPELVGK
jgi:hypothetical protein